MSYLDNDIVLKFKININVLSEVKIYLFKLLVINCIYYKLYSNKIMIIK